MLNRSDSKIVISKKSILSSHFSLWFIRYLKNFYKANLDINKPLALYVRIFSAKGTLKFLRITYARTHQEGSHKTKLIGLCLLLRL